MIQVIKSKDFLLNNQVLEPPLHFQGLSRDYITPSDDVGIEVKRLTNSLKGYTSDVKCYFSCSQFGYRLHTTVLWKHTRINFL